MDLNRLPDDQEKKRWEASLFNHDGKFICSVISRTAPLELPPMIVIAQFLPAQRYDEDEDKKFQLQPHTVKDSAEWTKFQNYMKLRNKVAVIRLEGLELTIKPTSSDQADVFYASKDISAAVAAKYIEIVSFREREPKKSKGPQKGQLHPEYLTTISQTHAAWAFGGIAELIDNARDAQAKRLEIKVEKGNFDSTSSDIPMLCFSDNGKGMNHDEIVRMVCFGHGKPEEDDPNQIGHFGVGFKTGAMRLGKDAIVFTRSKKTMSIAFLSTSYNAGKDALEIPIVTYAASSMRLDYDVSVNRKEEAAANERTIVEYSPFNKYSIGMEFGRFETNSGTQTGTRIYIYHLEKGGEDYSLQWDEAADITIRKRRARARPGQTSQEVPLDYSLKAYLEVMFLEPRMIVSVQGKQVKTKCLAKSLNNTRKITGSVCGKTVDLILGRNQAELKRGNCGMFLYWHGRLIEAYKRVGNMVHNADWGRGVIGVVDTTTLMEYSKGKVGVLNSKQGFADSDEYVELERWLAIQADQYWEDTQENLKMEDREGAPPDNDWVQCNKCLKWRVLRPESGITSDKLPDEWFCYMPPFNGLCKTEQEQMEPGVVTVGVKRGRITLPPLETDVAVPSPIKTFGRGPRVCLSSKNTNNSNKKSTVIDGNANNNTSKSNSNSNSDSKVKAVVVKEECVTPPRKFKRLRKCDSNR